MTESLKKETKKSLLERIAQLTKALQRERADATNSRLRFNKERQQITQTTQLMVLGNLLPLLDNFQRAFEARPTDADLLKHTWVKGVLQIQQQLASQLQQLDLKPMVVINQSFDPQTMEAVATVKDTSKTPGLVVEEVLKGYFYKDQVLRPAQVKVIEND